MKEGKLSDKALNELVISRLPSCSGKVIEGPGTGLDCGVTEIEGEILAVSTDPVTSAGKHAGRIAVYVSCNDIASCGIRPSSLSMVIILPESSEEEDLIEIVDDISETAKLLGIDIVGGHTEVSSAVNRPVIVTTAFGTGKREEVIYSSGAKTGDSIVMTKYAAIEGTSIIASDHRDKLKEILTEAEIDFAESLGDQLSVVQEGIICGRSGIVSAMHDITEGGVLGAAREMAEASGHGCTIDLRAVKLYPQTRTMCNFFGIDPYRLISSGSMLIASPEPEKLSMILNDSGITCSVIGRIVEKGFEYTDLSGEISELPPGGPDELYKIR